jgi:hypothetical protein
MSVKSNDTCPSIEEQEQSVRDIFETVILFCKNNSNDNDNFHEFEKGLQQHIRNLACALVQLFLICVHSRFNMSPWLEGGKYFYRRKPISRSIKTTWGAVRYWRCHLKPKNGTGGFYPLDACLGLTRDGFSQGVISLAVRLSTQMSFSAAANVLRMTIGYSPAISSIEEHVLGLGDYTSDYMNISAPQSVPVSNGGDEILIIEADGKATPTATDSELEKRRGPRNKNNKNSCGCKRHRCQEHKPHIEKKRRKAGDKSKNGRSITLVAMYTLKKGADGKLHGPYKKKIYGSYSPRKVMLEWAADQAEKRGFSKDSPDVHIVLDGEKCLHKNLSKFFPNASFSLDIYHLEEHIWLAGRSFHRVNSKKLKEWVHDKIEQLYTDVDGLITSLEALRIKCENINSCRKRYKALHKLLNYMKPRREMLRYTQYKNDDLPIASGVIEGAARYVIGERMDCSGMRWIPERAEQLLQLRCIEINGDWDDFFSYYHEKNIRLMKTGKKVQLRKNEAGELAESFEELSNAA